ncbi:ATP-binding protein [Parahaliea mediterranea]|uniref:ATP-binding protein n=1 Tax=Parahaliea mediterranea TaxID=651086 RepID=UPI000E2EE091|nr:ATP-binding protein [Parahaliea mediterranea]
MSTPAALPSSALYRRSLSARILLASLLLVLLFLGSSGLYLERSHRLSIEAAQAERLQLQVLTLLAQADYSDRLQMPTEMLEPRLNQASSGLYARITGAGNQVLWQSRSALTLAARWHGAPLGAGERRFQRQGELYRLDYQVIWETATGAEIPLRFSVLESSAAVDADLATYRRHLWLWLGGSTVLFALTLPLVLYWSLGPLRRLAGDIAAIEAGRSERLEGAYPAEVRPLTTNLNRLLQGEQQRRQRARDTLADLAHSLKTPLAVVASADPTQASFPTLVHEQAQRMQDIVDYQLQRGIGGGQTLLQTVPVAPVIERLCASLAKVYSDRKPAFDLAIEGAPAFRGDERDLLEMLGNLLDNACKYGAGSIRIQARQGPQELTIAVEDNGPGIPAPLRERVRQRGSRADTQTPGQGIGLAVASDIAASYGGALHIGDGQALGGARLSLHFPA